MIRAILTDIEGTTTSLSFVKDCLFPFSNRHMEEFLRSHLNDPQIREVLMEADLSFHDLKGSVNQLRQWIQEDRKVNPLKVLQGLIWEEGYKNGSLKGHIYPDAYERLKQWHHEGLSLYVYSSGSIHAQKLLFAHSIYGDMTGFFSGYFDMTTGGKKEVTSYQKIAEKMGLLPQEVLFLSDLNDEVEASLKSGMYALLVKREESFEQINSPTRIVKNFYEIDLYASHSLR